MLPFALRNGIVYPLFLVSRFQRRLSSLSTRKEMILSLRKETGAAFSICQEALISSHNDKFEAINYIRQKLVDKSDKLFLQERKLTSGLVAVGYIKNSAALVKINCETDFVAKTQQFYNLTAKALKQILSIGPDCEQNYSVTTLKSKEAGKFMFQNIDFEREIKEVSALLGEKLMIESIYKLNFSEAFHPGVYVHASETTQDVKLAQNSYIGRIGSLVLLKHSKSHSDISSISRLIAQHITGINPFLKTNDDHSLAIKNLMDAKFLTEPEITVKQLIDRELIEIIHFHREEQDS